MSATHAPVDVFHLGGSSFRFRRIAPGQDFDEAARSCLDRHETAAA
ncbi:hypothetical protein ACFPN0_10090 [Kitasatospora cinereorecta]